MKYALIDIGSNSMRLTVYNVSQDAFRILFKEKIMAGLASYVADGRLSDDGIARACEGLLQFRETLEALGIRQVSVFATASLRNVNNTRQAADEILAVTGFPVDVITGREEAIFGYWGAMAEFRMDRGVFIDIGGASTEVVTFSQGQVCSAVSVPIGSLKLYRDCVKKLLPSQAALARMEEQINRELAQIPEQDGACRGELVCVGGTARAALKLVRHVFRLPRDCRRCTAGQLDEVCSILYRADRAAADLILKVEPERIHTMIPGVMILQQLVRRFETDQLLISQYGVREGYLCQKIQARM